MFLFTQCKRRHEGTRGAVVGKFIANVSTIKWFYSAIVRMESGEWRAGSGEWGMENGLH